MRSSIVLLTATLLLNMVVLYRSGDRAEATLVDVVASQDAEVTSGTQFVGQNQSNQGAHPEIEPIRANDGFDTRRRVYLQFDFFSDPTLANALTGGDSIVSYSLYAYNVRNFVLGDAAIEDVLTSIHYVANDAWAEGPYQDWTVINSADPEDGITWDNQVGINEFLDAESEDGTDTWYQWNFTPEMFVPGGSVDDSRLISLAMVPNDLNKQTAWWLVSSFASREYADPSKAPFLRVETHPIPEPSTLLLLGWGALGLASHQRRRLRKLARQR